MSPLLAQSGHLFALRSCPLLGVKRTWISTAPMSAYDPKRKSSDPFCCDAQKRPSLGG